MKLNGRRGWREFGASAMAMAVCASGLRAEESVEPRWKLEGGPARVSLAPQPAEDSPSTQPGIPPAEKAEDPSSFWSGWSGSVEGGLNGSDGNSESLDIRANLNAERKVETMETKLTSQFSFSTNGGEKDKNRWFNEARNDWLFGEDHRWSFFTLGQAEYDDFQDWTWRFSAFAGPGYKVIKNDKTTLNLRAGAGLTKYLGGDRNEIIPEGLLAADIAHQLTERQKLTAGVEYYPSFRALDEFRVVARAGWEILIDPEVNMLLKVGVEDRYDSDPGDEFKKNDIDYFILIGWKF